MAFRVADAARAYARAIERGAKPVEGRAGPMELNIPAIEGIGGSLIYLVDRYGDQGTIYDVDFERLEGEERSEEHTSELQSLMSISYAVFCLKKKRNKYHQRK